MNTQMNTWMNEESQGRKMLRRKTKIINIKFLLISTSLFWIEKNSPAMSSDIYALQI